MTSLANLGNNCVLDLNGPNNLLGTFDKTMDSGWSRAVH